MNLHVLRSAAPAPAPARAPRPPVAAGGTTAAGAAGCTKVGAALTWTPCSATTAGSRQVGHFGSASQEHDGLVAAVRGRG